MTVRISTPEPALAHARKEMWTALHDAEQAMADYADLKKQLAARHVDPARHAMLKRDSAEFLESREDFTFALDRVQLYAAVLSGESSYREARRAAARNVAAQRETAGGAR